MTTLPYFLGGIFFLAVGAFGFVSPYPLARFVVGVNAVGSTRDWEDVEPEDGFVEVTRYASLLFAVCGGLIIFVLLRSSVA